ncbi:hypothetical protein KC315_g896 [Hortaea werneckii]|nr:hypothetical protein KC315_g896 [Hortaea werneckii]KAI7369122.1 hypothetical protein KC354_g2155 [Hortaea werneckii]KAI7554852.1 hypothetical protein KC331_g253 [Hortaea werneckii]KAI7722392.1 hypothetical protein KC353_g527 [Hortaea werneckii]
MQQHNPMNVYENQAPSGSPPQDPCQPQHTTWTSAPLPANQYGTTVFQSSPTTAHTASQDAYQHMPVDSDQPLKASPQSVLLHAPHFAPQAMPNLHAQAGRFIHVSKWAYGLGPSPPPTSSSAQQFFPRQPTAIHGPMEGSMPSQAASEPALGVNQAYQQGWPAALTPSTQVHTPPTPTYNSAAQKRSHGEIDGGETAMPHSAPHQDAHCAAQGGHKHPKVTDGHDEAGDVRHGVEQRVEMSAVDELEFQSLAEAQQNQHNFVSVLPETAKRDKIQAIQESDSKQRDWVKAIVNAMGGDYKQLPDGEHDKFPGHVQEWQRFQSSNLAKVRKAMQEKGKRGVELAAWALLGAVLKGHSRGLRQTGTWTVDKRSTVAERLQKCVKAIQDLPIVGLDTLKGQGTHEFPANPESFAKRKIGNLWVNYYKKLAAKGIKIPKEERSMGAKSGDSSQQQNVTGAGEEHDDEGAVVEDRGPAVEGEVEEG